MIVKIWAIKSNTVKGGRKGIKDSLNYITDKEKVYDTVDGTVDIEKMEESINNTIEYMGDKDKIEKKYISGYLCNPEFAVEEFMMVKEQNLARIGKTLEEDDGNAAYHIVQSFPDDIDISNEEIHQCGLELCKKIGLYQAVITSHVHPVIDKETGELKGTKKHNHILINSHCMDPVKQFGKITKMKYNDCKETYAQLQVWNDEIAKEHNLPIIENPDKGKSYSWYENDQIRKGTSWKQKIRTDIDNTKKVSNDWDTFIEYMKGAGYEVKEGKYVSYKAEGQERSVRDKTLGREYMKDSIINYWQERERLENEVKIEIENNDKTTEPKKQDFYFNPRLVEKRTKKPYKIGLYTSTGRERGTLELVFLLAMVIINKEYDKWKMKPDELNLENPIFGKKDWKLQNMVDAIKISREENVTDREEIKTKLNELGTDISKLKVQIKRNDITYNKMKVIDDNIKLYEEVKDVCELLQTIPDGEEKEQLLKKHTLELKQYKKSKAILYRYKIEKEEDIEDFLNRFKEVCNKQKELENRYDNVSEQYRKLKKLEYNLSLAENEQYCFGPAYSLDDRDIENTKENKREIARQREKERK